MTTTLLFLLLFSDIEPPKRDGLQYSDREEVCKKLVAEYHLDWGIIYEKNHEQMKAIYEEEIKHGGCIQPNIVDGKMGEIDLCLLYEGFMDKYGEEGKKRHTEIHKQRVKTEFDRICPDKDILKSQ